MTNTDIESLVRNNCTWQKLPKNVKQLLGNSQKEYEKQIVEYSVKNQLRHKGNIIRHIKKDEEQYYKLLLQYSREHLMLYPYHLADIVVRGLRITPFQYYIDMMKDLMEQERSYDSLPNFTAADCLRLLKIGRNEYIDLMNQARSNRLSLPINTKWLPGSLGGRKPPPRNILPAIPVDIPIQPWWVVQHSSVWQDDLKSCSTAEKFVIDELIEEGKQFAGTFDVDVIRRLYIRGLVYFDVPVSDTDVFVVPPLDGFVMNRVLGDYFENLLYKIFVSIDEHTNVSDLASNVLQIDLPLVKNALSVFCRLGIAIKKSPGECVELHSSWKSDKQPLIDFLDPETPSTEFFPVPPGALDDEDGDETAYERSIIRQLEEASNWSESNGSVADSALSGALGNRVGFLFDSTLTACLMMGNLSKTLKSHAVTLFEVGKLAEEQLSGFVEELDKIIPMDSESDSEAIQYWEHACVLRETVRYLRKVSELDLMRCESLMSLERAARCRVLRKNYRLLVSMAPLSNEVTPINCSHPPLLGPPISEVNSPWFKLFIYHLTKSGPISMLISKGTRLKTLPRAFNNYHKLLMNTWSHDPGVVANDSCLPQLNEALQNSAVFIQGYTESPEVVHVPFPSAPLTSSADEENGPLVNHPAISQLCDRLHLPDSCGYVTLIRLTPTIHSRSIKSSQHRRATFTNQPGGDRCYPSDMSNDAVLVSSVKNGQIAQNNSLLNHSNDATTPVQQGDFQTPNLLNEGGDSGSNPETAPPLSQLSVSPSHSATTPLLPGEKAEPVVVDATPVPFVTGVLAGEDLSSIKHSSPSKDPRKLSSSCQSAIASAALRYADWALFDLVYGVPLFDTALNRAVCDRMASMQLHTKLSLEKLTECNRNLSLMLLEFIKQFQDLSLEESIEEDRRAPFPTLSLVFEDGQVRPWNGD